MLSSQIRKFMTSVLIQQISDYKYFFEKRSDPSKTSTIITIIGDLNAEIDNEKLENVAQVFKIIVT